MARKSTEGVTRSKAATGGAFSYPFDMSQSEAAFTAPALRRQGAARGLRHARAVLIDPVYDKRAGSILFTVLGAAKAFDSDQNHARQNMVFLSGQSRYPAIGPNSAFFRNHPLSG
jgi:hypothetical protein